MRRKPRDERLIRMIFVGGWSRRWRGTARGERLRIGEGKSEAEVIAARPPLPARSQPAVPPFADGACATRRRSLIVARPRS
jgi:hypothetical protein